MATTSASAIAAGSACSRCHDPCYAAESVVFHGKTWHTYCFACSGCSKGLTSVTAVEHESNPYCAKCHGAFGTTGFGGALGANTGVVSSAEAKRASIDVNSNRSGFVDPLKEKQKMKAQSIAASTIKDNGSATSAQLAVERNRQAARAAERALEEDDAWDPDADDDDDFAGSAASTGIAGAKGMFIFLLHYIIYLYISHHYEVNTLNNNPDRCYMLLTGVFDIAKIERKIKSDGRDGDNKCINIPYRKEVCTQADSNRCNRYMSKMSQNSGFC